MSDASTSGPKSPMMNAISSIVSLATFAISSTSLCTIGFPAIGISGFGTVKVCGLSLEPRPAIGTIIFIIFSVCKLVINLDYNMVEFSIYANFAN